MNILSGLQMPACVINTEGQILVTNAAFASLSAGGTMIKNICTHFRSDVYPDRNFPLEKFANEQTGIELLVRDKEYTAHLHPYREQGANGYLVTFILGKPALTISPELQAQMLRYSVDCIKLVRTDGSLEYMNRAGCVALGLDEADQSFGMQWLGLLPADARLAGQTKLDAAINGAATSFPGRSIRENGEVLYWDNLLMPVNDPKSGERKVICVSRNVTEEVQAKAKLKQLSETDELTGLFNRRYFNEVLRAYFANSPTPGYLLLIDLDNFKSINDTHGHHAGDHLLQTLATRWLQALPKNVVIARLGGDEFAVLCTFGQNDDPTSLGDVLTAVTKPSSTPIEFDGSPIKFGISIGGVATPDHAVTAGDALSHADVALRQAKSEGKGIFCSYRQPNFPPALT